jgi:acyl carrier protein
MPALSRWIRGTNVAEKGGHQAMKTEERVVKAIFSAIDEVNLQLPTEKRLEKSIKTALLEGSGKLDSLGIVNLIVAAEQNVEQEFGIPINLIDEEVLSQNDSPFSDVNALVCHIARILEEKNHE